MNSNVFKIIIIIVILLCKNFFESHTIFISILYNDQTPAQIISLLSNNNVIFYFLLILFGIIGDFLTAFITRFVVINEYILFDYTIDNNKYIYYYLFSLIIPLFIMLIQFCLYIINFQPLIFYYQEFLHYLKSNTLYYVTIYELPKLFFYYLPQSIFINHYINKEKRISNYLSVVMIIIPLIILRSSTVLLSISLLTK